MNTISSLLSSCEICFHTFNGKTNVPKLLPCCGKTLCLKCLIDMKEGDQTCLWCRATHDIPLDRFPENEKLLEIIKEGSKWEICPFHLEPIKLYCFTDKCKICAYCGYSTPCKDHQLVPLSNLSTEVEKSRKKCEGNMDEINARYNTACDYLQKTRLVVEELINEFFEKQEAELKEGKAKIIEEFSSSFDEENKSLEAHYEVDSLAKDLKKARFAQENFFKAADPGKILQDYCDLTSWTKVLLEKEGEKGEFEKELSDLIPKIQEILTNETSERRAKWEELHEKILNLRNKAQVFDDTASLKAAEDDVSDTEEPQNEKNLCFDFSTKSMTILSAYECYRYHDKHPTLNENFLQNLTEIELDFTGAGLNEASSEELDNIFGKIKRFSALKIGSRIETEEVSEKVYSKIFEMLSTNSEEITHLASSFPFQNESVVFLNSILPKLSALKNLSVQFWPCKSSPASFKNLKEFSKNLALIAPGLVSLSLDFCGLTIPVSFIRSLYLPMPLLESFSLNISKIKNLGKKTLRLLTENIKELMPNLVELTVDISDTRIRSRDLDIIDFQGKTGEIERVKVVRGGDSLTLFAFFMFWLYAVFLWSIFGFSQR